VEALSFAHGEEHGVPAVKLGSDGSRLPGGLKMRTRFLPLALVAFALVAPARGADDVGKKMTDPVSMKQVTVAKDTPYVALYPARLYFESAKNRETFLKAPETYLKEAECPLKGIKSRPNKANRRIVNDRILYFCCANCPGEWEKDPSVTGMVLDPVSGTEFSPSAESPKLAHRGTLYYFESAETRGTFEKDPAKYAKVVVP
jgi:YHS domain-containing protein